MQPPVSNSRRIQVVYYLSRGGQLEHPHLLELNISSTEGLYLRDVKKRLTLIRGKGVGASFSWSYKRSYKNGYVWQDICDDDLIFPAHGCEYVLKGSEIFSSPDKLRTPIKSSSSQAKHPIEFQKIVRGGDSLVLNVPPKHRLLEKATEISEGDGLGEDAFLKDHNPHTTLELGQSNGDSKIDGRLGDQAQTRHDSLQKFVDDLNNCSTQKLEEYDVYRNETTPALPNNGTDAATQTEDGKRQIGCSSFERVLDGIGSKVEEPKKHSELENGEVSPPPWCSSSSSASTGSPVHSEKCRKPPRSTGKHGKAHFSSEKSGKQQNLFKRSAEGSVDFPASSSQGLARKSSKSQMAASSRSKHSGAAGLLQFVSCGGLDIKDDILPMSLYLKTKGSQHPTTEQVCELLRSGNCRPWYRLGRRGISKLKSSGEISAGAGAANNLSHPEDNAADFEDSSTMGKEQGIVSKTMHTLTSVLPDVISLGRSSSSDQSSNFSRELDQNESKLSKADGNAKATSTSKEEKSSRQKFDFQIDASKGGAISPRPPRSKSKGECLVDAELRRMSPSTPPKNEEENAKPDVPIGSGSLEQGDENSRKEADNGQASYQNRALLWEGLLAPKKDCRSREEMLLPPQMSKADWERRLQNAVDQSLPPPDFHHHLQECVHCGRKFRPDSLKVHIRSCSTQKACRNNRISSANSKNVYSLQRPYKSPSTPGIV